MNEVSKWVESAPTQTTASTNKTYYEYRGSDKYGWRITGRYKTVYPARDAASCGYSVIHPNQNSDATSSY